MVRKYKKHDIPLSQTVVDREEYSALCALRDGLHEELQLKCTRLVEQMRELREINIEQVNRLNRCSLEATHQREYVSRLEAKETDMKARLKQMETDLNYNQNAVAENTVLKKELVELRARVNGAYPAAYNAVSQ